MNFHLSGCSNWIFLDLDDTLWDFAGNSLLSLHHVYDLFSIFKQEYPSRDEFIDVYHQHNSALWTDYAKGNVSADFLKTERWRRTLFPDSDPQDTPPICSEINTEYLSRLASLPNAVAGAHDLLTALSDHFLIGVISNGFADTQYRKLDNSGLWQFVTRMIISDEIGIQKPDRQLFDYAIRETGATGRPIMIGDNPDTDIMGALKAGWEAIWFNPQRRQSPFTPETLASLGIDPHLYIGETDNLHDVLRLLSERSAIK